MYDKLTSSNYVDWNPRLEDYLYCKDLYKLVLGDKSKQQGISDESGKICREKLSVTLENGLARVYSNTLLKNKADVLWNKLEHLYERKTRVNKTSCFKTNTWF